MTDQEIERLVALVVEALLRQQSTNAPNGGPSTAGTWLPIPVRPEPEPRTTEPPLWSGAAQRLEGISPRVADEGASTSGHGHRRRASTAEMTNAVRAAAAGRGAAPEIAPVGRSQHRRGPRARSLDIDVAIGVSNHHVHLSPEHARQLFAIDQPTLLRPISQPGQFAATETVTLIGPRGKVDAVRVVGPARSETQVEISLADAHRLGIVAPVSASGALNESAGGLTVQGAAGSVVLSRGVIVAARHLHLSSDDAARWGIADGDRLDVRVGAGARAVTYHHVLVRAGKQYATELHLDSDEAFAAAVKTGDRARIIASAPPAATRRALVTERDVLRIAREGGTLPRGALLTPSARDRARAAGLET